MILGRGAASFRRVQLGRQWIRRARANAADALDAADIFLYRDFSLAPLLDMRRRFKAVMDLLDAMIRYGVSLSRSVELTAHWDLILALGPMYPVTLDDFSVGRDLGIGALFDAAAGVHRRLCDFIHQVVVHRRDEAVRGWRNWIRKDPLVHPYRWLRSDLVPPVPFLQCKPHLTPDGSGVPSDPNQIDAEFRKAWLPYFCRSGQRETSLDEFGFEVDGWLSLLPEVHLPRLTGQMLADVVHRKGVSAGGLDGWGWRELKVLPVSWFDELARVLTKVEDLGVWPDGLLDAYIAMIPKADGDSTPLDQRPLSMLPVVYRLWASLRLGHLREWVEGWSPHSVFSLGNGLSSVEAWFSTALDIEEVLSGTGGDQLHVMVADVIKSFDTVILDCALGRLGLPDWLIFLLIVRFGLGLSLLLVLVNLGVGTVVFHRVVRLVWFSLWPLYVPWCRHLESMPDVKPQLCADNLKCSAERPGALVVSTRFTALYVRSVGQDVSPGKCVLLSFSKSVRKAMKLRDISGSGRFWNVQLDVRDLGGEGSGWNTFQKSW